MKKIICTLCSIAVLSSLAFAASFKKGSSVYVTVKSGALKGTQGIFSKKVASVGYGDVLTVVESNDKKTFVKIPSKNISGWISNGSLTYKKIASAGSGSSVSQTELALAGKGFSAEAEKAFKSSGKALDYASVDAMEKVTVSESDLEAFILEGKLNGGEQ